MLFMSCRTPSLFIEHHHVSADNIFEDVTIEALDTVLGTNFPIFQSKMIIAFILLERLQ